MIRIPGASRGRWWQTGACLVVCVQAWATDPTPGPLSLETPLAHQFTQTWLRDNEYISYIEALDLSPSVKTQLWDHLTRKYQARAQLEATAQRDLGAAYEDEVDYLIITYGPDTEYYRRLEQMEQEFDQELRALLSDDELRRSARFNALKEEERRERRLRHQVENMELDLTPDQVEQAVEILQMKPRVAEQGPVQNGAAGFSQEYMLEREKWRFEQEQIYLEDELVPLLSAEQLARFRKWQEVQRIQLQRDLDMYRVSETILTELYPQRKRRVQLLVPEAPAGDQGPRPLYLECRAGHVYEVPLEDLYQAAVDEVADIERRCRGKVREMARELEAASLTRGEYTVDLSYALLSQLVVRPRERSRGKPLDETPDWLKRKLTELKDDGHSLTVLARDDSFRALLQVKSLAAEIGIPVSYLLLDEHEPIKMDITGKARLAIPATKPIDAMADEAPPPTSAGILLEVHRDHAVLRPSGEVLLPKDLTNPGEQARKVGEELKQKIDSSPVLLVLRPHSVGMARQLKAWLDSERIVYAQTVTDANGGH